MKYEAFKKAVTESSKYSNYYEQEMSNGWMLCGFKLNRERSHTFYNFEVIGEDVFFSHAYSQITGKVSRSRMKAYNILTDINYYSL